MSRLLLAAILLLHPACLLGQTVLPSDPGKAVGFVQVEEPAKWVVLSATFEPIQPTILEGGRSCIFEGPAGRYAVFAIPPGDAQPHISIVVLGGAGPTPPIPVPPTPPGPGPQPPDAGFLGLTRFSFDEAMKVPASHRGIARALGENFSTTSARLAAGGYSSVQDGLTDLKNKNNETATGSTKDAWVPWFTAWNSKAQQLITAGTLKSTSQDFASALKATADGLSAAQP